MKDNEILIEDIHQRQTEIISDFEIFIQQNPEFADDLEGIKEKFEQASEDIQIIRRKMQNETYIEEKPEAQE